MIVPPMVHVSVPIPAPATQVGMALLIVTPLNVTHSMIVHLMALASVQTLVVVMQVGIVTWIVIVLNVFP